MPTEVERLAVLIEANTKAYENAMKRLEEKTDKALRGARKSVEGLNTRLKGLMSTATRVAGIFGVTLGARALADFVMNSIKAGEAIGDTAQRLGITAEAYQELAYAAEQSGAWRESLEKGFKAMSMLLGEAARGSKSARAEFAALGFSWEELQAQSPDQAFTLLLDRIGKLENPLERGAELAKVFGKAGLELAGMAAEGAGGIDELRRKADELGIVLSNETIAKAQEGGNVIQTLGQVFSTAGTAIAVEFIPVFKELAAMITSPEFKNEIREIAESIGEVIDFIKRNKSDLVFAANVVALVRNAAIGNVMGMAQTLATAMPDQFMPKVDVGQGKTPQTVDELARALGFSWARKPGATVGPGGALVFPDTEAERAADKIRDIEERLRFQAEQLTRTAREQAIYNDLQAAGVDINTEAGQRIADLAGKLYDQEQALQAATEAMDLLRDAASDSLSGIASALIRGENALDTFADAAMRTAEKVAQYFIDMGLNALLGAPGSGPGFLSFLTGGSPLDIRPLPARAAGGPVNAGTPYLVGERGPEIFIPHLAGRIAASAGGAPPIRVTVVDNVGVRVSPRATRSGSGIDFIIGLDEAAAGLASSPGSRFDKAMQTNYGLTRQVTRRAR